MRSSAAKVQRFSLVETNVPEEKKILIHSISKEYRTKTGSFLALDNVSIHVCQNEFVSLVGPSGCGKSTLLRILAGLEEATSGTISVSGHEIEGPGADRGMVFQSYTLFPWLTVRENIEFGLSLKKVPPKQRKEVSDRYLELVSLVPFADSYPKELSGGMKQRVAIARALANSPEVLLMDEPFAALDAQTKSEMQELLLDIWEKEKTTVVFITHDIEEAIFLSQRLYVMQSHPGRIELEVQIPDELRRKKHVKDSEAFIRLKREIISLLQKKKG
ncbi:ABC transporter ATP-binding protein [Effusibacillus lacus]|uniref:ABC transporter ATP-binding protein n=1 Tax=Effusibacillus lacus TaxID=1348429 RepID=A0A292YMZ8_9BACL|nr:ABC transporter ATP-binding protein [Effusibacillus lacus]TCS71224.1 NitT/TauT family transport system ATP-binding protein [Effusibacillus lacus]GAX89850.1 ABC transporter ATP-binding protein [Effusibacillus lacus]